MKKLIIVLSLLFAGWIYADEESMTHHHWYSCIEEEICVEVHLDRVFKIEVTDDTVHFKGGSRGSMDGFTGSNNVYCSKENLKPGRHCLFQQ